MTPIEKRKLRLQKNKNIISKLYNGVRTIYGPYNNSKDFRYRVVLYDGHRRITRQYSKLKMEIKLNRRLGPNETVAHLDDNYHNDRYSNLRVIGRSEHIKRDVIRVKFKEVKCIWCGNTFMPVRSQFRKDKAGPFCSKNCTGKYGQSIQMGHKRMKRRKLKAIYYKNSGNSI